MMKNVLNNKIILIPVMITVLTVFFVLIIAIPGNENKTNNEPTKEIIKQNEQNEQNEAFFNCYKNLYPSQKDKFVQLRKKNSNALNLCKQLYNSPRTYPNIILSNLPDMKIARGKNQQTILLDNGSVLIIGGDGEKVESVELFDSKSNQFILVSPDLGFDITEIHSQLLYNLPYKLPGGNILLRDKVFDIKNLKFRKLETNLEKEISSLFNKLSTQNNLYQSRFLPVNYFDDGNILLAGKDNSFSDKLLLINPVKNKFFKEGKLIKPRSDFDSICIDNTNIIILGGIIYEGFTPLLIELYNPNTGMIEEIGKLSFTSMKSRIDLKMKLINKDSLLIMVEGLPYIFNVNTQKIQPLKLNNKDNINVYSDYILSKLNNENFLIYSAGFFELFDYKKKVFIELPQLKRTYTNQKITVLKDGKVLITGGEVDLDKQNGHKAPKRIKYAALLTLKESVSGNDNR